MSFSELAALKIGDFSLGRLCSSALTLLICLLVMHLAIKLLRRLLEKTPLDKRVSKYILAALKLIFYVVTALIVIDSLGVPVTSLVALLSVGSLGITLAAEDILGNVAGGLVILSSHPFSLGDYVEVSGTAGTVSEITLNHTKLVTLDGLLVMLPNKELAGSKMTNHSTLGCRRVTQVIHASYDAPTETVKMACAAAFRSTEHLLNDPAPAVHLTAYGESAIEYTLYCWTTPDDFLTVRWDLAEHLRDTFADFNVEMTYRHLNVHLVGRESGDSTRPAE